MPRSPLATRLSEIHSPVASLRENADLISRQRVAKSASALGQRPDRVEMVRQHDDRIDCERVMPARLAKRGTEPIDVLRQQPQSPLRQIDGEEEAAPSSEVATIAGHAATLA